MIRFIVCDWNGTLFRDRLEEKFFLGLYRRALWRAVRRGRPRQWSKLCTQGLRCCKEYFHARKRPQDVPHHIQRIISFLNRDAYSGWSRDELVAYLHRYGKAIQGRLDMRLIRPLRELRQSIEGKSIPLGIMSSGCCEGIEAALRQAGLEVEFVIANTFFWSGEQTAGFDFSIQDNKEDLLRQLLDERQINPADVLFLGDSLQDEGCLAMVGHPVVSPWSDPMCKDLFAKRFNVFAPDTENDFREYLQNNLPVELADSSKENLA